MVKKKLLVVMLAGAMMLGVCACGKEPDATPASTAAEATTEAEEVFVDLSTNGIYVSVPERWKTNVTDNTIFITFVAPDPEGKVQVIAMTGSDGAEAKANSYNGEVVKKTYNGKDYFAAIFAKPDGESYDMAVITDFSDDKVMTFHFEIPGYKVDDYKALLDDKTFTRMFNSYEGKPEEFQQAGEATEGGFTSSNGRLLKYEGNEAEVEVPANVGGYDTVYIDDIFQDNTSIKKVTIPEGVERLSANTFCGCTNLEEVILPKSLKFVGPNVFRDCPNLKDLTIPEGVEFIGTRCFDGSGVGTLICSGAEFDTEALQGTTFEKVVIGEGANLSADKICYTAKMVELELPKDCPTLGAQFADGATSLRKVILPENLTEIPESCFTGATLRDIDIPESVTKIGKDAVAADMVYLRNSQAEFGENAIWAYQIYLYNVYSPDQVSDTFLNITTSDKIFLPMDATMDEEAAFDSYLVSNGWSERTWIGTPIEDIDPNYNDYKQEDNFLVSYEGSETVIKVPYYGDTWDTYDQWNILYIKDNCFAGNTTVTEIYVGRCLEIGSNAFDGCTALKSLWLTSEWVDNTQNFKANAFAGVPEDITIHVPESWTDGDLSKVKSAMIGAGLPESASFETYSLR